MRVVDLSIPIKTGAQVFPGYPVPVVHTWTTVKEHGYYSNLLILVEHTLTHVDAPAHFIEGAAPVDELPVERFIGKGVVLDFSWKPVESSITASEVEEALREAGVEAGPGWIVLFHTGCYRRFGTPGYFKHPGLDGGAAKLLAELNVNAVGIDAPSIDHDPYPAHKILLGKGIPIYECLANLEELLGVPGFKFIGLPLRIKGGSASPVRAVAMLEE